MNITVFGGTGPTGRELIRLALADGHKVTAVARNPAALADLQNTGLTVRAGDVLDAATLAGTVDGADAVLSALGSRTGRAPTTVYSAGTAHILDAMRAAGVRRLVALTAGPMGPREQRSPFERLLVKGLYLAFGGGYDDMARMEELLRTRAGDLDWTVIRPPRLTDKPATGRYRSAVDSRLDGAWSITRADLARSMLAVLDDPATVRAAVRVAN
ncbi:NAD(P)-dependent oxidoreductase [Pseudonocardia acaciae]|uniref:NAD(P)-dependent oxidoreductase n=1 Tax=Pseudonocardia acaciae TaxID=551276 RepID=UPI00048BC929|nr:SDR family oxidoreductase [Pseudonocardia acaciae]